MKKSIKGGIFYTFIFDNNLIIISLNFQRKYLTMMHNANDNRVIQAEKLRQKIARKIAEIDAVADELPGVIIIHDIRSWAVEYMSPRGLQILGVSVKELKEMGQEYHTKFFNPEDAKDYAPKIFGLLERNNSDEIISFFQQVRPSEEHPWAWHFSTIKILMRDEEGPPLLTITMASPIDPQQHETAKVERLLKEKDFLRNNFKKFAQLSKREREVLRLMALGKSAVETAEEMFIAEETVKTHRRNIKKKLDTHSFYELNLFARAFDLV